MVAAVSGAGVMASVVGGVLAPIGLGMVMLVMSGVSGGACGAWNGDAVDVAHLGHRDTSRLCRGAGQHGHRGLQQERKDRQVGDPASQVGRAVHRRIMQCGFAPTALARHRSAPGDARRRGSCSILSTRLHDQRRARIGLRWDASSRLSLAQRRIVDMAFRSGRRRGPGRAVDRRGGAGLLRRSVEDVVAVHLRLQDGLNGVCSRKSPEAQICGFRPRASTWRSAEDRPAL